MSWIHALIIMTVAAFLGLTAWDRYKVSSRSGMMWDEFRESLRMDGVPETIATAVYRYYSSVALGPRVAISLNDDLNTLRIGGDDLDEQLNDLLIQLALELPGPELLRDAPHPIRTIRDIACWLEWARQNQG